MSTPTNKQPKRSGTVVRILSNYSSLCSTFVLGLVLVRLLLQLGDDAFGLVVLLGAGTGLVGTLKGTLRASMIPELGAAYHDGRESAFEETYSGALVFSFAIGLVAMLMLLIIGMCLSGMRIPVEMLPAARWFLVAKSVQAFLVVLLAPSLNMYVVAERMVAHNGWMIAERVGDTLAAAMVLSVLAGETPSTTVVAYGVASATVASLVYVLATWMIARSDHRLIPWPSHFTRAALGRLSSSIGWNACVSLANTMYTKLDAFIMNLAFGLFGNVVFGVATQLCFYVRQLTIGTVTGIDAVSARVSSKSRCDVMLRIMRRTAQLQAIVVFPATCWLVIWCETIVRAWVGSRLGDPATAVPVIIGLVRLFVLGVAARSLSEGWMKVLAGSGHARKFAPTLLGAAMINPLLVGLFLYVLPESMQIYSPAIAFSGLLILVHLAVLPGIVARHFDTSFFEIIEPVLRPLIATSLTLLTLAPWMLHSDPRFASFVFFSVLFVPIYSVVTFCVVPTAEDRQQLFRFAANRTFSQQE